MRELWHQVGFDLLMVAVGCVVILVLFFALRDIVSKRAASRYRSSRCASWLKVKNPGYERR
jgi:hypothetical protein